MRARETNKTKGECAFRRPMTRDRHSGRPRFAPQETIVLQGSRSIGRRRNSCVIHYQRNPAIVASFRAGRAAFHFMAIAASLATVFILRPVPCLAAGILSFESAIPSP